MNRPIFVFVVLSFAALVADARAADLNASEQGAVGDGKTDNTQLLQSVIDRCHDSGGGVVMFPVGRYLTGTLQLRDNVTLRLAAGAELLGSTSLAAYRNVDPFQEGLGVSVGAALIAAVDAKNIGIEGKGTINGRGREIARLQIQSGDENWGGRPFLLRLVRCTGVKVSGVRLENSGAWTFHLFQCKHVSIDGITIHSVGLPHNDGIDIDSCEGLNLKNASITSGDDAICLKTTSLMGCGD